MASFLSSVKRKLASLLPFTTSSDVSPDSPAEPSSERPHKRQRLRDPTAPLSLGSFCGKPRASSLSISDLVAETNDFTCHNDAITLYQTPSSRHDQNHGQPSDLLRMLPADVLAQCLTYLPTKRDRFALQTTCTLFRNLSNADAMLVDIDLGGYCSLAHMGWQLDNDNGDDNTNSNDGGDDDRNNNDDEESVAVGETRGSLPSKGRWAILAHGGILQEKDDSRSACEKLIKFAAAGNIQSIYFLGMILCYCHENIHEGLSLLRHAASHGHLPATYSLALILRDSRQRESDHCLQVAASQGFIPAWQEKLTATEMRAKFGDLDAVKLSEYFDPPCLNRLLGRHYLECQRVRKHQTSHCWNPLCGRWAYKAMPSRLEEFRQRLAVVRGELAFGRVEEEIILGRGRRSRRHSGRVRETYSIESLLPKLPNEQCKLSDTLSSPLGKIRKTLEVQKHSSGGGNRLKVSRMKMCSSCRRAKYCSKLCQVYDWRSGRHKMECQFL